MSVLTASSIKVSYGSVQAVRGVDVTVHSTECVAILGPNGAGKTSLLRAISGLVPHGGKATLDGHPLEGTPEAIVRLGVGQVLEGRHVFTQLSVFENLNIARFGFRGEGFEGYLASVLDVFPMLKSNLHRLGGQLSGGQQQTLAIARAMLTRPSILLLDEPSLGLAPIVVEQLTATLDRLKTEWRTGLLIADQNIQLAMALATRVLVLSRGEVIHSAAADSTSLRGELLRGYLGAAH
jgi:branched-chain amino acid transport system ATP-binding protein